MDKFVLSVFELNTYVSDKLYRDPFLDEVWVRGEIGDLNVNHGIAYFVLQDDQASVDCMLFDYDESGYADLLLEGQGVLLNGDISVYRKNGRFRIAVRQIELAGLGELYARLNALKEKLEKQGVFAVEHKRPLPGYPKKIGIVTSGEGAAVQDIMHIARRRNPAIRLVLYPVKVQGADAPEEIVEGIRYLNENSDADVLIVGRGGGAAEDLFAFNDERVVMEIFHSRIPVISAVGHESDMTLADFAADMRAPTPSAAAELAVPVKEDVAQRARAYQAEMRYLLEHRLQYAQRELDFIRKNISAEAVRVKTQKAGYKALSYKQKMELRMNMLSKNMRMRYNEYNLQMEGLNPLLAFERGYSIALKDGKAVKSVADVVAGDVLDIRFADGSAQVKTVRVKQGE